MKWSFLVDLKGKQPNILMNKTEFHFTYIPYNHDILSE